MDEEPYLLDVIPGQKSAEDTTNWEHKEFKIKRPKLVKPSDQPLSDYDTDEEAVVFLSDD